MERRDLTRQLPVRLFREWGIDITRAETGLEVDHRNLSVERRYGRAHHRRGVLRSRAWAGGGVFGVVEPRHTSKYEWGRGVLVPVSITLNPASPLRRMLDEDASDTSRGTGK